MKKYTRCLAAIVAFVMLLTMVPFAALADDAAATTDTAATTALKDIDPNTAVGKAVTELVKLGIINGYEDGTYRPDNTITRGEIAKVIITFLNLQNVAYDTVPSGFEDVDSVNHWAKKYIKLAADQKIVNGYEDGTFRPDAPVKYTEIVKMLVCAVGYGQIAVDRTQEGSAWYAGYMAVAAEKGILKGASVNNVEDNASRGVVAILTNNCLGVETAEVDDKGNTTVNTGTTALEKLQGKEKINGIVTGVQQTGIYTGATGLTARQIQVEVKNDIVTYEVEKGFDTMSVLGRGISAYVEDGDFGGDKKISQITNYKTSSTVITPDMIQDVKSNAINYYESETSSKAKQIGLDNVSVIYNGKYDPEFEVKDFENVKSGKIELICNDNDGDAEVAIVSSYEIFVVSSVDKNTKPPKVYDKYGNGELEIPLDENNGLFSLTKTGSTSEPETIVKSLSEWDVISVMRSNPSSQGKAVWQGVVTSKKASGNVKEKLSDTRKTIGSTTYDYAYNFTEYTGTKPAIAVGDYVTVYLDHEGKIAAASASAAESNIYLAYMITAERSGGINGKTQVNLYGITGTTKQRILEVASPVKIDGVSYKDYTEVLDALASAAAVANENIASEGVATTEYSQFIRYSTNAAGKVDMIDTLLPNSSPSDDDLVRTLSKVSSAEMLKYDTNGRFVDGSGSLTIIGNSSTKVLYVPLDVSNVDGYAIKTYTSFTNNSKYKIEAFNVSSTKSAKYILAYVGTTASIAINEDSPIMLASEISTVIDNDEKIDKAVGYNFKNGSALTITSESEGIFKNEYYLGDIFRYVATDGKVVDTKPILRFGSGHPEIYEQKTGDNIVTPIMEEDPAAAAAAAKEQRIFTIDDTKRDTKYSYGRFVFGTVLGLDDGQISITPTIVEDACGIQDANAEVFNIGSAKIYVYDYTTSSDKNKVTADASIDNIKAYMKLAESGSADPNTASQVLLYHGSSFGVKAIIIFKY